MTKKNYKQSVTNNTEEAREFEKTLLAFDEESQENILRNKPTIV